MNTAASSSRSNDLAPGKPRALFWKLLPLLLLGTSLSGWFFMVRLAVDDPGFAVEPDYYEKATRWDQEAALRAASQRLGWRSAVHGELAREDGAARFTIHLWDSEGAPLVGARVTAEALANARAARLYPLSFEEREPGVYQARLESARPGLWELRVLVERGSERFSRTERTELRAPLTLTRASAAEEPRDGLP